MAGELALSAVPAQVARALLSREPPLDPSSDQARQWLQDELADARYQTRPGLLQRLRELLEELFAAGPSSGLPSLVLPVAIAVVLAVLALVVLRVLRREVGSTGSGAQVGALDVPDVPAATLRLQARTALERGDWDTAVLDAMRALAREAVQRVILDDAPGRTAHEVATALGTPFPQHAAALRTAADAFDAVRYGARSATQEQASALVALDQGLADTLPVRLAREPAR